MFWSGNYIGVRELNFLLKEENVTLSQVLEADDILQECKVDNKALIQFLTKPEILAELITLITEEPPKNLELASQYRHANIACEVLTSHLSMLSDRLSLDAVQMNRLCDFLNKDPPLNPLLASYFSKTVEMLLERSPKQDCYLYHIVCLRVLDFFKSRRDFLPNLLRHMSTSAIADTFKYFIRLDDLFKKTVMEWLEEHQFLECLIQIICGTYVPEEIPVAVAQPEPPEKAERETSEKPDANHKEDAKDTGGSDADGDTGSTKPENSTEASTKSEDEAARQAAEEAKYRIAAVASANAASLLCDLIVNGCAAEGCVTRRASWELVWRLQSEAGVRALLGGMFTSPPRARRTALVNGCQVLRTLLLHEPVLRMKKASSDEEAGRAAPAGECEDRSSVELAVAPHLPLLHHALLHDPADDAPATLHATPGVGEGGGGAVGLARVQVAALLAHLALSEVEEVPTTMLTLGTPGVLIDMFFRYPNNNFLHAQVYTLINHALTNRVYRTQYARHLLVECDLLTRLMDVFEENQNNKGGVRAAYMGHVVLCLSRVLRALGGAELALPPPAAARWPAFRDDTLRPLLHYHDTPLGGYYPSENIYEMEIMADTLAANYDFNDMAATATMDELADDVNADGDDGTEMCGAMGSAADSADFIADGLGLDEPHMRIAKNNFLELASQRFDDDMWEESCEADGEAAEARDLLDQHSPWDSAGGGGAGAGAGGEAGWAQFGAAALSLAPHDPFAAPPATPDPAAPAAARDDLAAQDFSPFWAYSDDQATEQELEAGMRSLRLEDKSMDEASSVELANNLLTAMSAMSADAIANIVNANLPSEPQAAPRARRTRRPGRGRAGAGRGGAVMPRLGRAAPLPLTAPAPHTEPSLFLLYC
ncbi:unnamed protein product [Chrysodeixis includens]|uniref:Uncharacterized protein n=1 Tax=Chrysodeixis includens TaxID=689277 RepID=A0A9P0BRU9_CHRIL|nr:unnamed protein product [Chrysodeixis includens]